MKGDRFIAALSERLSSATIEDLAAGHHGVRRTAILRNQMRLPIAAASGLWIGGARSPEGGAQCVLSSRHRRIVIGPRMSAFRGGDPAGQQQRRCSQKRQVTFHVQVPVLRPFHLPVLRPFHQRGGRAAVPFFGGGSSVWRSPQFLLRPREMHIVVTRMCGA